MCRQFSFGLRKLLLTAAADSSVGLRTVSSAAVLAVFALILTAVVLWASVPTTINDFFLPGSQPGESGQLQTPDKCDNCHGGYDAAVEPAFNWRGGMMAQAARDPLFYACLAIANQDAPDSGDLCIRCHSPAGWLEGRSFPTDGSALNNNDREGVQCDFCHKLVKPTPLGVNPYPTDLAYTNDTYPQDQSYLSLLSPIPPTSANGMYIADSNNAKRGPFVDAVAKHQMLYSPFHSDAALCGTCHDVSNPAFSRDATGNYQPNALDQPAPDFNPHSMFPVERTFSEWRMSAFASGGVDMGGRFGGNKAVVSTCQDCHMQDVTGVGCNKKGAPNRNDLPLHDLTGGNSFIPNLLASLWPGEVNQAALDAGIARARNMLQNAATLEVTESGGKLLVKVINETAHKLPSGYPEGRRIWINVRFFNDAGGLLAESGAYDPTTGALTHDTEIKIYEIKLGISPEVAAVAGLPAGESFHFVLNNYVVKDNRIPPRGFTNTSFEAIQSPPVGYSYGDGEYWDATEYSVPSGTDHAEVRLFYQTLSKEYVEFLRDENRTNDSGERLYDLWAANGRSAPELMATATWPEAPADATPPTVPTNLAATAVSKSQIDLQWSTSTDNLEVAGYNVYRDGSLIDATSETGYQDNGLSASTSYTYSVTAFDAAGNESGASDLATATTLAKGGGGKGGGGKGGGKP